MCRSSIPAMEPRKTPERQRKEEWGPTAGGLTQEDATLPMKDSSLIGGLKKHPRVTAAPLLAAVFVQERETEHFWLQGI